MKNLIRYNIYDYLFDNRKVIVLFLYAIYCGVMLPTAYTFHLSMGEYILLIFSNQYYLIYCLIPLFLYFSLENIHRNKSLIKVRMKSVKREYLAFIYTQIIQIFIFLGIQLLITIVIACINFPFELGYSVHPVLESYNDTIAFVYAFSKYINNPIIASVLALIYLSIGLLFISILLYAAYEIKDKKGSILLVILLLFSVIFGFKTQIGGIWKILFLNNYLILHHVLFSNPYLLLWTIPIMAISIYVCYKVIYRTRRIKENDGVKKYLHSMILPYEKIMFLFCVFYVVFEKISQFLNYHEVSFMDSILYDALGVSNSEFNLFSFIRYLIFFIIPIFLCGIFLEKEMKQRTNIIKIRTVSREKWEKMIDKTVISFLSKYYIVYLILLFAVSLCMKESSSLYFDFLQIYGVSSETLFISICMSFVLRWIELIVLYYLFKALSIKMQSVTSGYVILFLLYCICIWFGNTWNWTPIGNSGVIILVERIIKYGLGNLVIFCTAGIIATVLFIKIVNKVRL